MNEDDNDGFDAEPEIQIQTSRPAGTDHEDAMPALAGVLETTRTELRGGAAADCIAKVIAMAADDCRTVLGTPAWRSPSDLVIVNGLSAARFFLSSVFTTYCAKIQLPKEEAHRAARALALAVLERLAVSEALLVQTTTEQWEKAMSVEFPVLKRSPVAAAFIGRQQSLALTA